MSEHKPASGWNLQLSYASLPGLFYERVAPTPVREPELVFFHYELARELGLPCSPLPPAEIWTGNQLPPGCEPIAQAYAGHQFGHFTMLGDGRAILLGEQRTPAGQLLDLQWKGTGPTPFSRRGDGRAALGPMLREVLISEALHHLGIPTTRGLAVAKTGEIVWRERGLPGAVLTRVAASHLRVGTFEYASWRGGKEAIEPLLTYALQRHYPTEWEQVQGGENPAQTFLQAVVARQARLIARWMHVGFIHGVMNTDNMAISGETIDFGPCAFLEAYRPGTVFSSIDHQGRYAYDQQPRIAQWNLARLAETLLPLLPGEETEAIAWATEAVRTFAPVFQAAWRSEAMARLGLLPAQDLAQAEADEKLYADLLQWMEHRRADYTNTFAGLCAHAELQDPAGLNLPGVPWEDPQLGAWWQRWRARLAQDRQQPEESLALRRRTIPALIPRNHRVEEALAAAEAGYLDPFHNLFRALQNPYCHSELPTPWQTPAPASSEPYRTFCGT